MKKDNKVSKSRITIAGIAIFIIAILVGLFMHTFRNMMIFSEINEKAKPYLSKTNVYKKVENKYVDTEEWLLDGVFMFKLTNKLIDAETISITKDNVRTNYEKVGDLKHKEVKVYQKEKSNEVIVDDVVKFDNIFEKMMTAFFSKVKVTEEDGKKVYEIDGKRNANFLYQEDTVKFILYIDYDTGLLYKTYEKMYNEDNNFEENTGIYTVEFDKNTEDMFKVENEEEYIEE